MAIRNMRYEGDELLRKVSKPVTQITESIKTLLDDMADTLADKNGLGLAAPQVGVLRRIFIVIIDEQIVEFINPEIVEMEGEQETTREGCLSKPGYSGIVKRPARVVVKAQDRNGDWFTQEGIDFIAIALCHEYDHLEGILYVDKAKDVKANDDLYDDEDDEDDMVQ